MSVTLPIADTTTTSGVLFNSRLIMPATLLIFAAEAIDEPPNLNTLIFNLAALHD